MSNIKLSSFAQASSLRPHALAVALSLCFVGSAAWAFDSGSTGADGALSPTVNTDIQLPPSGILNYTSISIPTGVRVRFLRNTLNTPVHLLVSGGATIAGTIDVIGGDSPAVGTAGDGNQADDGLPGKGGPGGFDGGRGGKSSQTGSLIETRGGGGLGPGGGAGGYWPVAVLQDPGGSIVQTGGAARFAAKPGANNHYGAGAGEIYGSSSLVPLIGGSGGGGAAGGSNSEGSGGGGGGGAILIAVSGTLHITGNVWAYGGSSGKTAGTNTGSYGGGGSGGAIRIMATSFSGNGYLNANSGCQYYIQGEYVCNDNTTHPHAAGTGRIRVEADAITFNGNAAPAYTSDTPGPVFLANLPSLRIATIGGQNVPANPTGVADVTFPANLANPVSITLATSNVPTGNTVKVKVIPSYGATQEALSPAITGSTAAGSASVQVNLPQGPSVIQAVTSYTVVVAMGEALSRFAQNERVEKVEIMATLGQGENQAKLITITGKEYIVPTSVLQMVGFKG
jgi:hypothetical protein